MKVSVFLFGKPRIRVGEATIEAFPTARCVQLMARLACSSGKRLMRDALANELWPEEDLEVARVRFRQELARLKRTFGEAGDAIIANRSFVGFDPNQVQVDVDDFLQLVRSSELTVQPREQFERRRRAAEIATAPFCEGLRDPWTLAQREELDELIESLAAGPMAGPTSGDADQLLGREFDVRFLVELLTHRLRPGEGFLHLVAPSDLGKSIVAAEVVRRTKAQGTILLDNPTVEAVQTRLAQSPPAPLICTSITPLYLPGEHVVRLHPLPFPRLDRMPRGEDLTAFPSIKLYLSASQGAGLPVDPTENVLRNIASLVERLEGWPLPIILAGRRAAVYPAGDLADRPDCILPLLTDRRPVQPERHRSFLSALAWNAGQIPASVQAFISPLAEFDAVFTAREVEDRWSQPGVDALETLVDYGFVEMSRGAEGDGFRLPRPIRDYAASAGGR